MKLLALLLSCRLQTLYSSSMHAKAATPLDEATLLRSQSCVPAGDPCNELLTVFTLKYTNPLRSVRTSHSSSIRSFDIEH